MNYHLLWCLPKERYLQWQEQWIQFDPFTAQHHWTATPQEAQQLPEEVRAQIHLLIGSGKAQRSTFSTMVNQWTYPTLSLWLIEDSKQWIEALRHNFSLCLQPPFAAESFAVLKKILFERFPSLRPERLELKVHEETIYWIPWQEVVQLHCKPKEVEVLLRQGKNEHYKTPSEQILPQLKDQIQFFPITPSHYINLNHIKEIQKIESNEYHCHLDTEKTIILNHKTLSTLRKFLEKNT